MIRRIFEFEGEDPQVMASTKAYGTKLSVNSPEWNGSRAEILICDCIAGTITRSGAKVTRCISRGIRIPYVRRSSRYRGFRDTRG